MSPEEAHFLHLFGKGLMGNFILFTVATVGFVCYLILVPISARILLVKRNHSKTTIVMSMLLSIIFFVTSFYWASYAADIITLLRVVLVQLPGRELLDQLIEVNKQNKWILKYQEWPLNINFVLCDAILVWRVHVIVSNRLASIATCALLFIDFGLSLAWGIVQTIQSDTISANTAGNINAPAILKVLSWTASLLTNIAATGMIAFQAWSHRLLLNQGHMNGQSTPVSRALFLLVESGAIFMAVQFIVIIFNSFSYETLSAPEVFMRCLNQAAIMFTAIYPTLIIIIVDRERSIAQASQNFSGSSISQSSPQFLTELSWSSAYENEASSVASRTESVGLRVLSDKPLPDKPAREPSIAC